MLELKRGARRQDPSVEAAIKQCGRTKQWTAALELLRGASRSSSTASTGYYMAAVSTCSKGRQWHCALALLSEMWEVKLEPDSATALGSARAGRVSSGSGLCLFSGRSVKRSWSPTS
ncbi:unnamed protein product [Prorocentrum cordatum]|uniref:Uncharacterized protein n=1 Tax=Prorocentrum cordatum TaxID=2364126 RepID=A0ABN9VCG6_9DINO|nr:unnamed protein product [Polarella glacialis]